MAQLIINIDDLAFLPSLKEVIGRLNGVTGMSVKYSEEDNDMPNRTTHAALDEIKNGECIVCDDYDDYLKKVSEI